MTTAQALDEIMKLMGQSFKREVVLGRPLVMQMIADAEKATGIPEIHDEKVALDLLDAGTPQTDVKTELAKRMTSKNGRPPRYHGPLTMKQLEETIKFEARRRIHSFISANNLEGPLRKALVDYAHPTVKKLGYFITEEYLHTQLRVNGGEENVRQYYEINQGITKHRKGVSMRKVTGVSYDIGEITSSEKGQFDAVLLNSETQEPADILRVVVEDGRFVIENTKGVSINSIEKTVKRVIATAKLGLKMGEVKMVSRVEIQVS